MASYLLLAHVHKMTLEERKIMLKYETLDFEIVENELTRA